MFILIMYVRWYYLGVHVKILGFLVGWLIVFWFFSPNIKMQLTRMHVKGKAPNHLKNKSECVNLHFSLGKTEEFLSGWKGKNKLFKTRLNHLFCAFIFLRHVCRQVTQILWGMENTVSMVCCQATVFLSLPN